MATIGNEPTIRMSERTGSIILDTKFKENLESGKQAANSFTARLADMAQQASRQRPQKDEGLRIDAIGRDLGLTPDDPVAPMIREARQRIEQEKYKEALEILSRALRQAPNHHEGLYLTAYCLAKTNAVMEAMRSLQPLTGARLEGGLAARVELLRGQLRQVVFVGVVLQTLLAVQTKRYDQTIATLSELVHLDPGASMFHFMLAGTLMNAGRMPEALAAAQVGMAACHSTEAQALVELQGEIRRRWLVEQMEPARKLYRRGDYHKARAQLRRLPAEAQALPLWITFEKYLALLDGGVFGSWLGRNGDPTSIAPQGSFKEVDDLYFFLVRPELAEAQELVQAGRPGDAEPILAEALRQVGRFHFANFLYALCLYERLGTDQLDGQDVIAELERALPYAKYASADKEIGAAGPLLETIQSALRQVNELRAEAAVVNRAGEEFGEIISMARDGISSVEQYNQIRGRLQRLQSRLPQVRAALKSPQGIEAFGQLSAAVERNLTQLNSMQGSIQNAQAVARHFESFNSKMAELSRRGITSPSQLVSAREFFSSLERDITRDQTRFNDAQTREALGKLLVAVRNVLTQLAG